jgi:NADH-quinone oxidoreductase subunit F
VRLVTENGTLRGVEVIRNKLGERGSDGRRRPVPIRDSETVMSFDTVIVAISEEPDGACVQGASTSPALEVGANGNLIVDPDTLMTSCPGIFAGGDLVTGPNTVVDAIAAGKKAALMIVRWLNGEELDQPRTPILPDTYLEPVTLSEEEMATADRAEEPTIPVEARRKNFSEVELPLSEEAAVKEAHRCLRCDLEFTQSSGDDMQQEVTVGVVR